MRMFVGAVLIAADWMSLGVIAPAAAVRSGRTVVLCQNLVDWVQRCKVAHWRVTQGSCSLHLFE